MAYQRDKDLIRKNGDPIPQYWNDKEQKFVEYEGKVGIIGETVAEQKNNTNADVNNVLTFSEPIEFVEIYHNESGLQTFVVNGISLQIASGGWRSPVSNTNASVEVTIPEGIVCTVARLI